MLNPLNVQITTNWKILQEMGIPDHLTCFLWKLYADPEATFRTRHGQQTGSKLGKAYVKAVYCHPAYLIYIQTTSWEVPGWMKHNKLRKSLKVLGIPDHLTCLLRNLYAGQEATVRTGHGSTDWFQIGKGACQGCILSPCLFNLYAEYIMRSAWLDKAQAGIKIAGRNINSLRYADGTTLMAEIKEELKNLLRMTEESENLA